MATCFCKYKTYNRTRGHSWALVKERCKLNIKNAFYIQKLCVSRQIVKCFLICYDNTRVTACVCMSASDHVCGMWRDHAVFLRRTPPSSLVRAASLEPTARTDCADNPDPLVRRVAPDQRVREGSAVRPDHLAAVRPAAQDHRADKGFADHPAHPVSQDHRNRTDHTNVK